MLDPGSTQSIDPAIKAAMAETTILTETRVYLADQGINLSSFTTSEKSRSENVIIVKNFPYGTAQEELITLFGGSEVIKRIILPPAGTIAFIEFLDPGQCRAAFKRLAYRRFKDVPLYLEKAPKGIFHSESKPVTSESATKQVETEEETSSTIYVKNLDFSTTQNDLLDAFNKFPGFRHAILKTKPPNAKGEILSMGFGFITFQSKESATTALNSKVTLTGRTLEMKFARQTTSDVKTPAKSSTRKKLIVKNLGFSVTKRDLRELFGTYGHIQSIRLPKKFDNTTRGFAFVEFTTGSDARNAMDSLKHTHLLGRHLVLEWAEEESGFGELEKLRGRVREGVEAGEIEKIMGKSGGGRVGDVLNEDGE
jgi:multiple RNA-binding domain-containing protein 1